MGKQARLAALVDYSLLLFLAVAPMRHGLEIPALLLAGGVAATRLALKSARGLEAYEMTGVLAALVIWMPCVLSLDSSMVADILPVSLGILIPLGIGWRFERSHLSALLWSLVVLNLGIAISTAWQAATGFDLFFSYPKMYGWKLCGPFPYVYMDTLVFLYIAAGWYLYANSSKSWRSKALFAFYLTLNIAILVGSGTRSAMLQLATTFIIATALTSNWTYTLKAAMLGLASALVVGWLVVLGAQFSPDLNNLVNRFEMLFRFASRGESADADVRWFIWKDLVAVWFEYPFHFLFGQGFGSLLDRNQFLFGKTYLITDDAQNAWFDIIYSTGAIGAIMLICHGVTMGRRLLSGIDPAPRRIVIFLLAWWISPLSVQHKFMDVWYNINIALVVVLAVAISTAPSQTRHQ